MTVRYQQFLTPTHLEGEALEDAWTTYAKLLSSDRLTDRQREQLERVAASLGKSAVHVAVDREALWFKAEYEGHVEAGRPAREQNAELERQAVELEQKLCAIRDKQALLKAAIIMATEAEHRISEIGRAFPGLFGNPEQIPMPLAMLGWPQDLVDRAERASGETLPRTDAGELASRSALVAGCELL